MTKPIQLLILLIISTPLAVLAAEEHDHVEETEQSVEADHAHENVEANEQQPNVTDNDQTDHDEHEEGMTRIEESAAKAAGISTVQAKAAVIRQQITLTGRIILNRNTTAEIQARFPGIVKAVPVQLGQKIRKGQLLVRIESNDSLQQYNIYAPQNGVILQRNISVGSVAGDAAIFSIADLGTVWAEFHVFPQDLGLIAEGQPVDVHTVQGDKNSTAPISMLLPTADAFSQTVIAIVDLPNPNNKWRPGMAVQGDVSIKQQPVAIAVPEAALQRTDEGIVVYVQSGDVYQARPVRTGLRDNALVEITEGLEAGEEVVARGSFIIKADIGKAGAAHEH